MVYEYEKMSVRTGIEALNEVLMCFMQAQICTNLTV